jgi:hypothetical protein
MKRLPARLAIKLGAETDQQIPVRSPRKAREQGLILMALIDDELLKNREA